MSDDKPFFISHNTGFAEIAPQDEFLHPERNALVKDDSLTETQYFGFCIPEERIHAYCYLWHHPNLRIVGGGLFAWKGHKRSYTHGELCDYIAYMKDTVLEHDLHDYRLPNGYGVKVIEPLKSHHMTYANPQRGNSVDLHFKGVTPAIMFADGNHFEQAMKVTGSLQLRGRNYAVDCFTVRDRSWGKPRPEKNNRLPPASWMQGVFNEEFAFSCNMLDQSCIEQPLQGEFDIPEEKALTSGWVYRDKKVIRLVKGRKLTVRSPRDRMPQYVEFEATDEENRKLHVRGKAVASTTWMPTPSIFHPTVLMRWECEGMIAYGDFQEGIWTDYLNLERD